MEHELTYMHLEELKRVFGSATVLVSLKEAAAYLHKDVRSLEADPSFPIKIIGGKGGRKIKSVVLLNLARWLAAA